MDRHGQRAPLLLPESEMIQKSAAALQHSSVYYARLLAVLSAPFLSWRAPEGLRRLHKHLFILVRSMYVVYQCVLSFPGGMIQPVNFHSAMTKLQNYTAGKIRDYGVCIQNRNNPRNPEKAVRIRSLTLCIEQTTKQRICQDPNGPRVCLPSCPRAVASRFPLLSDAVFSSGLWTVINMTGMIIVVKKAAN